MNVYCFGGVADGQVVTVEDGNNRFKVADRSSFGIHDQSYSIHVGVQGDLEWYFATLPGVRPTEEMSRESHPQRIRKRKLARCDANEATAKRRDDGGAYLFPKPPRPE